VVVLTAFCRSVDTWVEPEDGGRTIVFIPPGPIQRD